MVKPSTTRRKMQLWLALPPAAVAMDATWATRAKLAGLRSKPPLSSPHRAPAALLTSFRRHVELLMWSVVALVLNAARTWVQTNCDPEKEGSP